MKDFIIGLIILLIGLVFYFTNLFSRCTQIIFGFVVLIYLSYSGYKNFKELNSSKK
ncbi:hypothetical protein [Peptoniphilus indolicus]|uniref:Uncharacterized protein n=1 Tax=Peptoniphilus indolicus ATCC 29427 TaxID=997350 RepID=G4D4D9_9FIRM|nr:hypothetical protein [Peptoniphilus indolicus]EGY79601.1 hypothetical protein HMPREF9129_1269 [Peptoniphilus indolicus ATCC 29427]